MSDWDRYYELSDEARDMEHGVARYEVRRKSATVADQIGSPDIIFEARANLAHDALKAAKCEDAFFAFIKIAAMYDDDPERFDDYRNFVMFFYGWSIGHMCFYASVARDQIDSTLAGYERRLNESAHGLGQLWMSKIEVGQHLGADPDDMERWYHAYREERANIPSSCKGCWLNFDVRFRAYRDEYDRMLAEAEPAFDGRNVCDSAPRVTYSHVVLPAFLNGDDRADEWFRVGYDSVKHAMGHISTVNRHFAYLVASDQLDLALQVFEMHASDAISERDDYDRISFCTPSQVLFEKLRDRGPEITMRTPSTWAYHDRDGVYDVDRLIEIFTGENAATAKAFDDRNLNPLIGDRLQLALRQMRGDD